MAENKRRSWHRNCSAVIWWKIYADKVINIQWICCRFYFFRIEMCSWEFRCKIFNSNKPNKNWNSLIIRLKLSRCDDERPSITMSMHQAIKLMCCTCRYSSRCYHLLSHQWPTLLQNQATGSKWKCLSIVLHKIRFWSFDLSTSKGCSNTKKKNKMKLFRWAIVCALHYVIVFFFHVFRLMEKCIVLRWQTVTRMHAENLHSHNDNKLRKDDAVVALRVVCMQFNRISEQFFNLHLFPFFFDLDRLKNSSHFVSATRSAHRQ